MKQTRRVLKAANTELSARLAACGPDATLSRQQLHKRLHAARAEVDNLTAQNTMLTAKADALAADREALAVELVAAKAKQKAAQPT